MFVWRGRPYSAGDIILVDFPNQNGRETALAHPAVIVGCCPNPPMLTVIPITSNAAAKAIPMTVQICRSKSNKLSCDSVALVIRIIHPFGRLDDDDHELIRVKLREHFNM